MYSAERYMLAENIDTCLLMRANKIRVDWSIPLRDASTFVYDPPVNTKFARFENMGMMVA